RRVVAGVDAGGLGGGPGPARVRLRGGVADGVGAAAGAGRGGARPAGEVARRLPVHDRPAGECGVGHQPIRLEVVHRGAVPGQQTGAGRRRAAALQPGGGGEGSTVGVVGAERHHGVVRHGGGGGGRGRGTGCPGGGGGEWEGVWG